MKHLILLFSALLLFASCAKKETAPPPETTKAQSPAQAGHTSGGAITMITPPSVVGGQVGAMNVKISPEGSSNPLQVGSPVSIMACSATAGVQLGTVLSGNTDTAWKPVPANVPPVKVILMPAKDSTTVNNYSVVLKLNGAPLQRVNNAPWNSNPSNPAPGFYFGTYYNGANFTVGTTAWVMAIDSTWTPAQ